MTLALSSHVQPQAARQSSDLHCPPNVVTAFGYPQSSNGLRAAEPWLTACVRGVMGARGVIAAVISASHEGLRH